MDNLRALTEIKRYSNGKFELLTDIVVREVSLTINVNGKRLVSLACLLENLKELALGFLFSEGLVLQKQEIISQTYNREPRSVDFLLKIPAERINSFFQTGEKTSGCGSSLSSTLRGSRADFFRIKLRPENILIKMHQFQLDSALFLQTGGVHRAGLIRNDKLLFAADDIGRHNAVDKVIGMAIEHDIDFKDCYLLCSGRISSEIVKKCVRLDIPAIVSHSAPTSEAIRLGWEYKVYIIGFARGKRFNIYTGFEEEFFR